MLLLIGSWGINIQCFPRRWMICLNNDMHWLQATWRRNPIIDDSDSVGISRVLSTSSPGSREREREYWGRVLLPLILSLDLDALLFKFDMPAFGSIWRDNLNERNRYECDKFAIFLFLEKSGGHQSWVDAVLITIAFQQWALVRFLHPPSYVVFWFSTLFWQVFPRVLRFSPHKNSTFDLIWFVEIQFDF